MAKLLVDQNGKFINLGGALASVNVNDMSDVDLLKFADALYSLVNPTYVVTNENYTQSALNELYALCQNINGGTQ